MLVKEYNGFLSFGTKLEDKFSKFLNINGLLIVQPIRYIFNEVSFEIQLTVCEGFMTL